MPTSESTSDAFSGVLGDAAHELLMTGLLLARDGARGGAALAGGARSATVRAAREAGDRALAVQHSLFKRLTDGIELRMTRLLNAFQIPTRRDLNELAERVDELTRQLEKNRRTSARRRATS